MTEVIPADYFRLLVIPAFSVVSVLMVALYVRIFYVARKQISSIQSIVVEPTAGRNTQSNLGRQMEFVKAGLIVFAAFYVCWIPFFATIMVQIQTGDYTYETSASNIRTIMSLVATINSAANPFIYAFRLPLFKRQLQKMFKIRAST